jgi:hypothetical protein
MQPDQRQRVAQTELDGLKRNESVDVEDRHGRADAGLSGIASKCT